MAFRNPEGFLAFLLMVLAFAGSTNGRTKSMMIDESVSLALILSTRIRVANLDISTMDAEITTACARFRPILHFKA